MVAIYPLFTLLFSAVLLRRERLHARLLAGVTVTTAGVVILLLGRAPQEKRRLTVPPPAGEMPAISGVRVARAPGALSQQQGGATVSARRTVLLGAGLGVGLLLAGTAFIPLRAAPIAFSVPMNATSEVPANDSKGTGTAQLTYDKDTKVLGWVVTFSGLTGPATAAHFHGPAAPGANAPVVIAIGSGGVTSPVSGHATLTDPQSADFLAGKWYVNVHTAAHPAGEIRGMVTPPK